MFGKLSDAEIEELISRQIVGRIGCHAGGITYVVPVSYAYDGTYVYGHTFEGMKIRMMRENPNVCFQVDNTRNLDNWKSVVAWGGFEEITEKEHRLEALHKLNARALPVVSSETMRVSKTWPFPDDEEKIKGIFFRIRLTEKTGRFEKSSEDYFFAT
jgi:nitroimidazol reductase NimA-like FMN-containing flavoprotein (pyridoxamine 5'-phosphate oxidase superfamily)